jgi:hypothetical protein
MGGNLSVQCNNIEAVKVNQDIPEKIDNEKYFRPSKDPIINDRDYIIRDYYEKKHSDILLPDTLFETPEDTIINYFSILREAANPQNDKHAGCGTLGSAKSPYPIAYNFLATAYQDKLKYDQYLNSFQNILHINLIKLKEIPSDTMQPNDLRYFFELETIEGSKQGSGLFSYYHGFMNIVKENNQYRIADQEMYAENYLCAPYHSWYYIAEAVVDIKFGEWCSLIQERYPTQQEGYVKKIFFKGTDGNDYYMEFFQLTNDNDIEIAQYKKNKDGEWELIFIDPTKCLDKK